jgi:putative transposase
MCKHLKVSPSGYYDWSGRAPSARSSANAQLLGKIEAIHAISDATYGMPRIRAELADQGIVASRKRIASLMRTAHIQGVSRRRGYVVTTTPNKRQRNAPDLVKRQFLATDINQLWVADMTYVPTWAGFLYLAVVTDVYSRKVVIHHLDQGSQYTSVAFGKRCAEMGVRPSMGTVGDAYDNAMAESFFATLECELIDRRVWKTHTEARLAIFTWIESWYNPHRRHSSIGYQSPINFERQHAQRQKDTAHQPQPEQHGLPTGCCAPVDKPPHIRREGTSACPQAGPVDNPAPAHSNYHDPNVNLVDNTQEIKNL